MISKFPFPRALAVAPGMPARKVALMASMVGARSHGSVLGTALRRACRAAADWWRIRRDIAFLQRQDERMLNDIGLRRGGVEDAVRGRYY